MIDTSVSKSLTGSDLLYLMSESLVLDYELLILEYDQLTEL